MLFQPPAADRSGHDELSRDLYSVTMLFQPTTARCHRAPISGRDLYSVTMLFQPLFLGVSVTAQACRDLYSVTMLFQRVDVERLVGEVGVVISTASRCYSNNRSTASAESGCGES